MSSCARLALVGECGFGGTCAEGECQCGGAWVQSHEFAGEARLVCAADAAVLRALWGACSVLGGIALLVQLKVAYDVGSVARKLPALLGSVLALLCVAYRLASGAEFGVSVLFTLLVAVTETLFILAAGIFLSKYANYLRQTVGSLSSSLGASAARQIVLSERITGAQLVVNLCGVLVFVAATIVPSSRPALVRAGWLYFALSKAFTGWLFYSTLQAFVVDITSYLAAASMKTEGGGQVGGAQFSDINSRLRRLLRSVKSAQRGTVAYHWVVVPVLLLCATLPSCTPWLMYFLPASYALLLAVFASSTGRMYLYIRARGARAGRSAASKASSTKARSSASRINGAPHTRSASHSPSAPSAPSRVAQTASVASDDAPAA
jgi:hypothetical protein